MTRAGRTEVAGVPVKYLLKDGDYSISGLERVVTIERKSPSDAAGSVMPPLRATFLERYRRFTTETLSCDGYCLEWCTTLCATTPLTSS